MNPADSRYLRYYGQCLNSSKEGVIIHEDGSKEAVLIWDEGEFLLEVSSDSNVDLDVGVKVDMSKLISKERRSKEAFSESASNRF